MVIVQSPGQGAAYEVAGKPRAVQEQASSGRGVGLQARHPAVAITKHLLFREAVPGFVFMSWFSLSLK